jgi:hypothetical protein
MEVSSLGVVLAGWIMVVVSAEVPEAMADPSAAFRFLSKSKEMLESWISHVFFLDSPRTDYTMGTT